MSRSLITRRTRIAPLLAAVPAGRASRWLVLAAWLAAVVVLAPFSSLAEVENNDAANLLPQGAESRAVLQLEQRFDRGDVQPVVVVYHRTEGLTAADLARAEEHRVEVAARLPVAPGELTLAEDGRAALFAVPLDLSAADPVEDVATIREIAGDAPDGLEALVTGPAAVLVDLVSTFDGIDITLLFGSVLVVTVILLLTYRSPFLWLLPLLTIGVAHVAAAAVVYGLVRHAGLAVNGQSAGLLPILVFGVGTDYALLLIARYREELRRTEAAADAMRVALRRTMPAILASSGTCIVGLLCLLAADTGMTRSLGPVGAAGIASAVVAMTTLLPALLVLLGRRAFWPFVPAYGSTAPAGSGAWTAIGGAVARRPRLVSATVAVALGLLAAGTLGLDTRLAQADQFVDEPESIAGQRVVAASFAAGATAPATVVAQSGAADAVEAAIAGTPGVAAVERAGSAGGLVAFSVVLDAAPSSDEAFQAIRSLRERAGAVPGAEALVGGPDASALDVETAASRDLRVVVPLVLAVVLATLVVLLRSLVAPVVLVATVVLSFGAALGASVLVFEHVLGFAAVEPSVPLLSFVFLVALGVDYNIFLVSRAREEAATAGTREGMLRALGSTGGVITSAGLVLAATFSVLMVMPLVAMVQLGFVVAFGVLLDAIVVRSVLVPAIAFDLDRRLWWPHPLARSRAGEAPIGVRAGEA